MGAGALAVRQSKSTVRLKEDMKKIAVLPLNKQRDTTCPKVFGVSLLELQQQGLSRNGIPIVVWNIVEYLTQHGMTQEGLFRVNGSMKMVEQLRLQYERGEEVELVKDADVYSAASLLKLFLRELPDSIITSALHPRFIQLYKEDISRNDMQKEGYLKELLKELPDAHYSLLKYLCRFLIKVAEHQVENRMNLCNLATIFGPNCFHVPSGFEGMKEQEICNKIMTKMLENYNTLFELEGLKKDEEKPVCEELPGIILEECPENSKLFVGKITASRKAIDMSTGFLHLEFTLQLSTSEQMGMFIMTKPPVEQCSRTCLLLHPGQSDGIPRVSHQLTDSGSYGKEMDLADKISVVTNDVFSSRYHDIGGLEGDEGLHRTVDAEFHL
ncbi:hypothetical protein TURU_123569 [Turdus rufiventris]|nr:hypothetical protein TURU_123569 [Turdus rufiventris]